MTEVEKYFKEFFPTALIDDKHNISMAQLSPDSVMDFAEQFADEQVKKALQEVEKSLPNDMDAYADDCIHKAIEEVINKLRNHE